MERRKIFINLPVKNLKKSMDFYAALGFTFNPQFTNESAACLVISEEIYAMLLSEKFFKTFTTKEIVDASKSVEVILALSADSKEEVDLLVEKAMNSGGLVYNPTQDLGFMYSRSFQDVDHHLWEVFYMDPTHVG